jgi:Na+/H+-dicarboxylate symporter
MEQPPEDGSRLTRRILWALGLGAVVGTLLHAISPSSEGWVRLWLTDGALAVAGQGFIRLLTLLVVPVVLFSLVVGTAALGDVSRLGRIGGKALGYYLLTTAVAVSLALALASLLGPGKGLGLPMGEGLESRTSPPLAEVLLDLIPRNAFAALAEGSMLQVILLAILLGLAMTLAGEAGRRMLAWAGDANAVVLRLVGLVLALAPVGVFALVARTFAREGWTVIGPLAGYFLTVLLALAAHVLVVYPLMIKLLGGVPVGTFLRRMRPAQVFAFSTASSSATVPVTLRCVESLGVSRPIAAFTVPLGATINMDGTAIMQGVATVFIAQACGIDLTLAQMGAVVATATAASIGTAGVPGVGLVMLSMVLLQVGLPTEGIGLILGVDRLLDMARTAVNVTGDAAVACVVARSEEGGAAREEGC